MVQWSRGSHRPRTSRSGGVAGPSRGGACRAEGRGEGAGAPWRGGRRGGATAAAHSGWAPLGSAERGAAMFARGSRKRLSGRSVSVGGGGFPFTPGPVRTPAPLQPVAPSRRPLRRRRRRGVCVSPPPPPSVPSSGGVPPPAPPYSFPFSQPCGYPLSLQVRPFSRACP